VEGGDDGISPGEDVGLDFSIVVAVGVRQIVDADTDQRCLRRCRATAMKTRKLRRIAEIARRTRMNIADGQCICHEIVVGKVGFNSGNFPEKSGVESRPGANHPVNYTE
jgi:hypothetical protein